jgi:type III secretory pathway component EscS
VQALVARAGPVAPAVAGAVLLLLLFGLKGLIVAGVVGLVVGGARSAGSQWQRMV